MTSLGHRTLGNPPTDSTLGGGSSATRASCAKLTPVDIIGRVASVLSIVMYVSYVTQIANNLDGHPGSPWQPLAAFFNCVMWTLYGFLKPKKDWPIIIANVPGIFLGAAAFITALVH